MPAFVAHDRELGIPLDDFTIFQIAAESSKRHELCLAVTSNSCLYV
jgi:hypothetical protein